MNEIQQDLLKMNTENEQENEQIPSYFDIQINQN